MIFDQMIVWTVEDVIAIVSTVTLFVSGALYADLVEVRRRIVTASAGAASANEADYSKMTLLLIQAIVPALIGLVGTIVTVLAQLLGP